MALHLNLYYEIHRQAARERRNPVKLAALAGLLLLLCLVSWYIYRLSDVTSVESKRKDLQARWAKLEPEMKAAVENEPALLARQKSNQTLVERVQGRFYWAPFLQKFATVTPANIQVITLTGTLTGVIDPAKDSGKTISVLVRGVAAGTQARTAAEDYRRALQAACSELYGEVSAGFDENSLEDGVDTVQINGETLGTATFRIRLQFHPPALPTPKPASEPRKSK